MRWIRLTLAGAVLAAFAACSSAGEPPADEPPNVLLIISDDQAYGDYGFMGHPHIETPRLDRLAAESLTFTRGYVAAPLCSPSLATIISGLYPHQHAIVGNDPVFDWEGPRWDSAWLQARQDVFRPAIERFNRLPLLTRRLAERGYRSLQTGKWWMGSGRDGGFDVAMTHGDPARGGRHGDAGLSIGREGLRPIYDFLAETRAREQPFFVWYAPFLPHAPHTPPEELLERYRPLAPTEAVARYWAMVTWFDQTCGALLDHLEATGQADNTLVIYVCDNGWIQDPDRPNRYGPRSKRTPYEGGIRTPIMLRWPGRVPARLDSSALVSAIDIVPTVLAAAGLPPDPALPGRNLLAAPAGEPRAMVFAEDFRHDIRDLDRPAASLKYRIAIDYPWKLILPHAAYRPDAGPELYNLRRDPGEARNLAAEHPGELRALRRGIEAWWTPEAPEGQ